MAASKRGKDLKVAIDDATIEFVYQQIRDLKLLLVQQARWSIEACSIPKSEMASLTHAHLRHQSGQAWEASRLLAQAELTEELLELLTVRVNKEKAR